MAKNQKIKIITERLTDLAFRYPDPPKATAAEIAKWIDEHKWLPSAATFYGLDLDLLVLASMGWWMKIGFEFERQHGGTPPTLEDRKATFYEDENAFARFIGILQPYDRPNDQLSREYGGV